MPTERRLAAILFTDIVGYTALMARDEEAGRRARDRHEAVVRPLVERYRGAWIERTGDETLSSFQSALDAVNCALAVQSELDGDADLRLRIGVHQGDVTFDAGGVSGDGVNVAARVRPLAEPGGIAISDEVHPSVEGQPHLEFKSLGRRKLRNVRRRVEVYAVSGEAGPAPAAPQAGVVLAQSETRSIAVLPLDNLGSPEQEYVADGVTDALIESLARVGPELRVISRTSVMQYKRTTKSAREIADELDVTLLIEGTAQRQEDRVLIRVQLIEAREDAHLWAQSYERDLRDFFSLQREIARAVAGEVEIALSPEREPLLAGTRPVHPEALDLYLRAVANEGPSHLVGSWGPASVDLLERSVAIDPDFAQGWLFLSMVHLTGVYMGSPDESAKSRAAAERVLELDARCGAAHAFLGFDRLMVDWDFSSARSCFERAVELSPSDPWALTSLALYQLYVGLGKSPEFERLLERLLQVAPRDTRFRAFRMRWFFLTREYGRGIAELECIREIDPEFVDAEIAIAYFHLGRPEDATRELLVFLEREPSLDESIRGTLQSVFEEGGFEEGMRAWTRVLIQARTESGPIYAYTIGSLSALYGEPEEALIWLERAYEARDPQMTTLKVNPYLDSLRSDPRFQDLLRRVGFPES